MRLLAAVSVFLAMCAFGLTMVANDASDEASVKKVMMSIAESWNQPGMPGFENLFTSDAEYVVITGKRLNGRDEIVSYHRNLLATYYKGSHLTIDAVDMRMIRPDVAIAHFTSHVTFVEDGKEQSRSTLGTVVLSKSHDQWRIDALQNTLTGGAGFQFAD